MRGARSLALLALAALSAACQHEAAPTPEAAQTAGLSDSAAAAEAAPLPSPKPDPDFLPPPPAPNQVPHIYMALQDEGAGKPVSVIFAIDAARNGSPSDDPAIRLTPEGGLCNPQEMTRFDFQAAGAGRPVVSEIERAEGLTAGDLPAFMAITVTNAMLAQRIVVEPEETRPLNICTRKLWEQLVVAENQPGLTAQ